MSSRAEATLAGIRLAILFFIYLFLNKIMDKTDNFINKIVIFTHVLLYFAIQPLKVNQINS